MSLSANTVNSSAASAKPARLLSLDALRGFDMFWIVSGEGIVHGLANAVQATHNLHRNAENWQLDSKPGLSFFERLAVYISNQLHHTPWNGFTFYDLIFPLFIFIAGVSMPFSFGNQLGKPGVDVANVKAKIYRRLLQRTVVLLLLGMVVNGALQFKAFEDTRFASVLGRIALACFFAAVIFLNTGIRGQVLWFCGLLLGYWAVLAWWPVSGFGAGVLTPEGNASAYFDRLFLPGKLHRKVYDPEGLLSTIPAIGSALLGVFTGQFLRWQTTSFSPVKKAVAMAVAGVLLFALGWCWGWVFPVNKNMWTSSFVLYAGGWSLILLAVFYALIDVAGYKKWCMPFVWLGANAILIYMAAHGVVDFEASAHFLFGGLLSKQAAIWQPAFLWMGVAALQFWLLYFLYHKKWFLKV